MTINVSPFFHQWKLLPIDPEFTLNITPGDKSEAKRIEEARQMVTLPAICLPT
jgi:hypothetical protein